MTARVKPPDVASDGKIVALQPAMLTVLQAALFCACSASYLNSLRADDAKRLKRGEQIKGPQWVRVGPGGGFGIRYRVSDLLTWLDRTSVACGVMESRRREKPNDLSDSESPTET